MKIGYIDYYLDNWHAREYLEKIRRISGGKSQVTYAYGMIPSPHSGVTSAEWCEKYGIEQCLTIEEVVEKSDVLYILSPEHGEMHEALAQVPLRSGKRTFIDKTFAPTATVARSIFALAEAQHTPCYSASALRFSTEYQPYKQRTIQAAAFVGPSEPDNYGVHHLEPLIMLMGGCPERVIALQSRNWSQFMMEWQDGRCASIAMTGEFSMPFQATFCLDGACESVVIQSDFHDLSVRQLLNFYETGEIPVSHEETITVIAAREACLNAGKQPGTWVKVPIESRRSAP